MRIRVWSLASDGWRVDTLRGVAILGVVAVHSSQLPLDYNGVLREVFAFGMYGVELFFFLSGFLMSQLYDRRMSNDFRKIYWTRRFARIFPLWALFSTLSFALWVAWPQSKLYRASAYAEIYDHFLASQNLINHPFVALLLTLTFMGFLSPLIWNSTVAGGWSIQSEMFHYLFYYLFRSRILLGGWLLFALGGVTLLAAFLEMRYATGSLDLIGGFTRLNPFSTTVFFLIGVWWSRRTDGGIHGMKRVATLGGLLFAIAAGASLYFHGLPFGHPLGALTFLGISLAAVHFSKSGQGWLKVRTIGKYSYFIYFFHFIPLSLLGGLIGEPLADFLLSASWTPGTSYLFITVLFFSVTILLSLAIAVPSYRYLESPLMRIARKN